MHRAAQLVQPCLFSLRASNVPVTQLTYLSIVPPAPAMFMSSTCSAVRSIGRASKSSSYDVAFSPKPRMIVLSFSENALGALRCLPGLRH
eukprot:2978154-Pyramimonas_sp.AAC.1